MNRSAATFSFLSILLSALVSGPSTSFAQNMYAPPALKDVVVEYDDAEGDFSLYLYHYFEGEVTEMGHDPTCQTIQVRRDNVVECVSANKTVKAVGELGIRVANDAEWSLISVKWSNQVRIVETQTKQGLVYSVRVTN